MNNMEFPRAESVAASSGDSLEPSWTPGNANQRTPLLTHYLSIARRRKWVILGAIAGMVLAGLLVTLLMTPRYTAVSTIEIQRETRNFTMVQGVEPENSPVDMEFYETQYGLLKARSLADRVATDLRLFDDAAFFTMFKSRYTDQWFQDGRLRQGESTRELRIREAGDILLNNLTIAPVRLSRLVIIGFTSPDPAFSKRIVDSWGQHFIQATLDRRYEATSYARHFLEGRLAQLRTRIDEAERTVVDYATRENIVNLPATTPAVGEGAPSGERSLVADTLANLNRELARATADRVQAESRAGTNGGAAVEALQNQAISDMRSRRAQLAADYARMMVQFEPNYPPARAAQSQVQQLDRAIAQEEARVQRTLREAYQSSVARERDLEQRVTQLQSGVLDLRRRSIQYNIFQRDADTTRQLYDALLQRYKEIGVAGGIGVNNISIVDVSELPEKPSSPRLLLNLVLALFAGIVLGIGAALALEQIDEGVADPGQVEADLHVPLLGIVPSVTDMEPIEALQDRKSSLSEAYMSLQTSLALSTDHGVPKTLAVTSSQPAEGKTTTSYALARSLSRAGRRTLLLDSDMRSPSIHHLFDLDNREGLSNYLSGSDDLARLIRATSHDGLSVITAGPQPPSASELLSSDRLDRLIAELRKMFDHIIIDVPPVMGLADAPLVASRAEGAIFVIQSHGTKKGTARVALRRLSTANVQVVGAVLTKFDAKRAHYGYGYDYGYGYGYGESGPAEAA